VGKPAQAVPCLAVRCALRVAVTSAAVNAASTFVLDAGSARASTSLENSSPPVRRSIRPENNDWTCAHALCVLRFVAVNGFCNAFAPLLLTKVGHYADFWASSVARCFWGEIGIRACTNQSARTQSLFSRTTARHFHASAKLSASREITLPRLRSLHFLTAIFPRTYSAQDHFGFLSHRAAPHRDTFSLTRHLPSYFRYLHRKIRTCVTDFRAVYIPS
jgi:hypothetical protein